MQREEALALAKSLLRLDPDAAFRAGLTLLREDYPEVLLPVASRLAERNRGDAQLAQLHGLAARAAGEGPAAYIAFKHAARLAPVNPLIAHSHARTALEAGKPSVDLFERAAALAPQDGSVLLGLAAALVAEGRASEALTRLEALLAANPLWTDGHRSNAHIRGQLGLDPLASLDRAIAANPAQPALHRMRLTTLLEARQLEALPAAIAEARRALGEVDWIARIDAHQTSERGDIARADALIAALPAATNAADRALIARHHLRAGRPEEASQTLEPHLGGADVHLYWPYLSLAWRQLDDPRYAWLEGDDSLVRTYDLADRAGDLGALAAHLRTLHFATAAPLDQSVRGGTQTDGNLLLRDEAPIQRLRAALREAVSDYVAQLAPPQDRHPTLIARREPQRIAGSWSVRLRDAGFHTDHVHSRGWISSAFYVALPDSHTRDQGEHAGWLSLGESRDLATSLAPLQLIEPRPGRLVLFPSTMWHGTRPFPASERLTVAFDIALPRQS